MPPYYGVMLFTGLWLDSVAFDSTVNLGKSMNDESMELARLSPHVWRDFEIVMFWRLARCVDQVGLYL